MYIHIHMYIYIYTYIYIDVYAHIHMFIHTMRFYGVCIHCRRMIPVMAHVTLPRGLRPDDDSEARFDDGVGRAWVIANPPPYLVDCPT